jgi:hypothetical protein
MTSLTPQAFRSALMLHARSSSVTIENLWYRLSDLSLALPGDEDDVEPTLVTAEDRLTLLSDEGEDSDDSDEDGVIPERFVYTRFILRQCQRLQEFVGQRRIGAAAESWDLIKHHSTECPDVIASDVERQISEILDELLARSPIDLDDRNKNERWLPALLNQVSLIIAAKVADDPALLRRMTPRAFEEFISKPFVTFGYNVELTRRTGDGGYDVVALKKYRDGDHKLLIEAKRYARARPVGVAVVRQLLQVRNEERATRVILATTSRFTKGARELCHKHQYELDLRDHDDLISWARDAADLLHYRDADALVVPPRYRIKRRD